MQRLDGILLLACLVNGFAYLNGRGGSSCDSLPLPPFTGVFNATVVPQGALGYLTLWRVGQQQPYVSTLNAWDGAITSNMSIVTVDALGVVAGYVTNTSDVILDLTSYFAPE